MSPGQLQQIGLIVSYELRCAVEALSSDVQTILRKQNAQGMLRSGNTLVISVQALSDATEVILTRFSGEIGRVARDQEAFDILSSAAAQWLHACTKEMRLVMDTVFPAITGVDYRGGPQAAQNLFDKLRAKTEEKLEILRYEFGQTDFGIGSVPFSAEPSLKGSMIPSEPAPKRAVDAAEIEALYQARVGQLVQEGRTSGLDDDLAFLNTLNPRTATRDKARGLRRLHAPEEWKKSGPKKPPK